MVKISEIDLSQYDPIEVNASYAKDFPHVEDAPQGQIWWFRPCYFRAMSGSGASHFSWSCPFCSHTEDNSSNYGKQGYICPECEAVFVGENWFGIWMAKLVSEEWTKTVKQAEIWC